MMTTLSTGRKTPSKQRRAGAFTLVELILVMALLVITVSLVMPTLEKFFGGRALDSEVKKFMALIHYGQSRAVTEGVPMMLWVDTAHGSYGLESEPGYTDRDQHAVENKLAAGLTIGTARNNTRAPVANSQTGRILTGQVAQRLNKLPAIYFMPDGTINNSTSIGGVSFQDKNTAPVWIAPANSGEAGYDITSENPNNRRR